jgi:hypothetical protein
MKENKERDPLWVLIGFYLAMLFGFFILTFGFGMLYTIWKALIG